MTCRDEPVDHIRGMTVTAVGGLASTTTVEVNLCPGALVYSYTFHLNSAAEVIPGIGAVLHLQDSTIEVPMSGVRQAFHRADLPGLAWPAFARLVASAGTSVVLILTYGHCS